MIGQDGIIVRPIIQEGTLMVDPQCRKVAICGTDINLSTREFDLLYSLVQHPGWVFTKEQICNLIDIEYSLADIDNIIYCLMYGLRKKLERDPKHPKLLQTVRGIGYRFCKE